LVEATALNMSNMVGVGPFVTIPLLIGAMGGPQCMLGWAVGAVLALCDGLVWAELVGAMPGEGGSYLYLREAFRRTRLGTAAAVSVHLAIHLQRSAGDCIRLHRLRAIPELLPARHGRVWEMRAGGLP
jgi:amino acid transporter